MRARRTFVGRWIFLGVEQFDGVEWQPYDRDEPFRSWEFKPQIVGLDFSHGVVVQTYGKVSELCFKYNKVSKILRVGSQDFELIELECEFEHSQTVIIRDPKRNEHVRYILQKDIASE